MGKKPKSDQKKSKKAPTANLLGSISHRARGKHHLWVGSRTQVEKKRWGKTRLAKRGCFFALKIFIKRYKGEANHWFGLRKEDGGWWWANGTAFDNWLVPLSVLGAWVGSW